MSYQIKQFRYYGSGGKSGSNSPDNKALGGEDGYKKYVSGEVFDESLPIIQLGIQTLPGTKFYLNYATDGNIIGSTGIYELDLENVTQITKLQFDKQSMINIKDNENAYLIVDIIYDEKEG